MPALFRIIIRALTKLGARFASPATIRAIINQPTVRAVLKKMLTTIAGKLKFVKWIKWIAVQIGISLTLDQIIDWICDIVGSDEEVDEVRRLIETPEEPGGEYDNLDINIEGLEFGANIRDIFDRYWPFHQLLWNRCVGNLWSVGPRTRSRAYAETRFGLKDSLFAAVVHDHLSFAKEGEILILADHDEFAGSYANLEDANDAWYKETTNQITFWLDHEAELSGAIADNNLNYLYFADRNSGKIDFAKLKNHFVRLWHENHWPAFSPLSVAAAYVSYCPYDIHYGHKLLLESLFEAMTEFWRRAVPFGPHELIPYTSY